MGPNTATQITNEMLMEQLMEMKSMIMNLQSEMQSLKNPVDDFTTKWVSTSDVMAMLRVSRRTIDNYIKAGKLTPTPIGKRNPQQLRLITIKCPLIVALHVSNV